MVIVIFTSPRCAVPFTNLRYVANADGRQEKELDTFQDLLPTLKPSQSLVFAHRIISSPQKSKFKLGGKMSKLNVVHTCLDQDPESIRSEFDAVFWIYVVANECVWLYFRKQGKGRVFNYKLIDS